MEKQNEKMRRIDQEVQRFKETEIINNLMEEISKNYEILFTEISGIFDNENRQKLILKLQSDLQFVKMFIEYAKKGLR